MLKKFYHIISVLSCLCVGMCSFAQSNKLDSFILRQMKEQNIPGLQLAVVHKNKIIRTGSYGIANIPFSVPVNNETIFQISSCTKAFTGVAVMQLVEKGKIDLAAPVSEYLDSLPPDWRNITITQLLTHVSGLPDILSILDPVGGGLGQLRTETAAWNRIREKQMDFKPGEQFSYNQTNYLLLGKIIDKYSEQPFEKFFQSEQFEKAGLHNTIFADSRDVVANMVQTYRYVTNLDGYPYPNGKLIETYFETPPARRTATGLNSTASDIARWIIALNTGKLLRNKSSVNTLWTPGKYNNGLPTQWTIGWMDKPRPAHYAKIATGGARSAFIVYPEDDLAIIVLTNLSGSYPEDFIDELAGFFIPDIPISDPLSRIRMQLRKQGFEKAERIYAEIKKEDPAFNVPEVDFNDWAYRLMSSRKLKEATAVFKLIVEMYPESWNAYDSYGEALMRSGDTPGAIKMYSRSVELNPDNRNGKKILEQLRNSK